MHPTKTHHFESLDETTALVRPVLFDAYTHSCDGTLRNELNKTYQVALKRRLDGGPLLRPHLARTCFELSGGKDWKSLLCVFAAVEALNISTYQSNYCFDRKAGVKTVAERNNQFIAAMLSLSVARNLLAREDILSLQQRDSLTALLMQANADVYTGQFIDLNTLNYSCLSDQLTPQAFTDVYLRRCDLIAGSTFRACVAGAIAGSASQNLIAALTEYLSAFGAAAQIINDLGDYIPRRTKDYAAPFSALSLGRLTLPLYLLARAGCDIDDWRYSLRRGSVSKVADAVSEEIARNNIEEQVRMFAKIHVMPKARHSIRSSRVRSRQVAFGLYIRLFTTQRC